jgi:4-amino-4-deoxy-L-arabinose transferase-like glycosyltransferase
MPLRIRGPAWLSRVGSPALAILLLTAIALALRLVSLADVPGNPYYDAAVRSMGRSWHNFFFAAFEPSARLGLDKPPVDLWFQVASTKVFGFHSFSLKLPEALAGAAAVPLLYDLVRRLFGTAAGLASALALAVLPLSVLTSRSDTMDSFMMALIVLAAWLVVRAAETGRARYLYGAALVLGIDFNVKLFQALIPLPALGLLFLMASPHPLRRRVQHGVVALAVLTAVSLSWLAAVSLAPAGERPFAIGSRHGSAWDAAFVFNGVHRLQHRPANSGPAGPPSGSPSATRLLTGSGPRLGRRIGSELVPAFIFGGIAAMLALGAGVGGDPGAEGRRRVLQRAGAAAIALWLAIGYVGFSVMSRLELRYLEAFTPAIAAALGVGVVMLARAVPRGRAGVFLAALAATAAYAVYLARGDHALQAVIVTAALAAAGLAVARPGLRGALPAAAGGLALVALLAVPVSDSLAIVRDHRYDHSSGGGFLSTPQTTALSRYFAAHRNGERYEAAVLSVWEAASLVVVDGRPVLATRNVDGAPMLSVADLRDEVRRGDVRYVLAGSPCMKGIEKLSRVEAIGYLKRGLDQSAAQTPCPPASRWAQLNGKLVAGVVPKLGLYRIERTAR